MVGRTRIIHAFNDILGSAFKTLLIYRELYATVPQLSDIAEIQFLPELTFFDIHKNIDFNALALSDCHMTMPVNLADFYNNIFPSMLSEREYEISKSNIYFLLNAAGVEPQSELTILSDVNQSYIAFDFSNILLGKGYKVINIFHDGNNFHQIESQTAKIHGDYLIDFTPSQISKRFRIDCPFEIIRFNDFQNPAGDSSFYYVNYVGFIAIKPKHEKGIVFDHDNFFLEIQNDGYLVLTCLYRKSLPVIRYRTFDTGVNIDQTIVLHGASELHP